jgi:predicted Zn finger-like uncharacterized protein
MECPSCKTKGRIVAAKKNVPITQDELTCNACGHVFSQVEKVKAEQILVAKRLSFKA